MAKKQKQPTKTCTDCIHESACRIWTDGRFISDASASVCPNHETVKESAAYLCGVLDERKRKQTNADRIRAMSDEELLQFILSINNDGWPFACQHKPECNLGAPSLTACNECFAQWLQQPAKEDAHDAR